MERKLATVLFVDLVDSTGYVSAEDPEIVRRRVTRYFEQVASCIEQHGGLVEKFAGDAVMAAFGVPLAHEDDAERAVRAAFAVLESVRDLGLEARVGVEAGEVVVGDTESTFATGEAVNLAARLQQAAAPGEIRLGPGARRLAAGAVEVEDAGPLEIRGRPEPIWTWRALKVQETRRFTATPFVGRETELDLLQNTYARAIRDQRSHLVTVFGDPGVGKSRLVREFTEGVERATVLFGRALPYGEGVTYFPLAAMIKASAGITDDDPANQAFDKLRVCCESEAVADLLAVALGVLGAAESVHTGDELKWAALNWAQQLAEAQPLVLVFEDVHWAEEPLLDVVEHVARELRGAPLLIVAVARAELLEHRPMWGGGNPRAISVELGPLDLQEAEELADALLARSEVPPAQRALLLEKAEGNPLFLEETARMLAEGDGALERIPDTVQALIAARIDRLDVDEKRLLQHAALIGRVFWRGALDHLTGDDDVSGTLDRLLDRELIVPEERSTISGDRAFRFKHVLIRDVAYAGLTKTHRAEDHRSFAEWLAEHAPDELAEMRAYHLDEAAALVAELDGEVPADLAAVTAAGVEDAGRKAFNRGAFRSARRLLLRASELEPTLDRRLAAARAGWHLADVLGLDEETQEIVSDAGLAGELGVQGRALVLLAEIILQRSSDVPQARELADEAVAVIPDGDVQARYDAHALLSQIGWWLGDEEIARRDTAAMVELARVLGRHDLESRALTALGGIEGVLRNDEEARELLARALELAEASGNEDARAWALLGDGRRAIETGEFDLAEQRLTEAHDVFADGGAAGNAAWALGLLADLYAVRGDLERAERTAAESLRALVGTHDAGHLVEVQRQYAEILVRRGKVAEAERYALRARRAVGGDDVWSRASTAHALALVRAEQGRFDEARSLLNQALKIVEPTVYKVLVTTIHESLAEVTSRAAVTRGTSAFAQRKR